MERIARHREDNGEDEGIGGTGESNGIKRQPVRARWIDPMVEDNKGEFSQRRRPQIGYAEKEQHLGKRQH